MLAAYRLLFSVLFLVPVFLLHYSRYKPASLAVLMRQAFLPGIVLGLHFISWVIGVRLATAANATIIVNLVPLVMPVFMYALYRESINTREVVATIIALLGLAILAAGDVQISQEHLQGDIICFVSMLLFGFYLALGRNSARYESIWLYIVPVYFIAGIFCFITALFFSSPFHAYSTYEIAMILGLAIVPTVIGHTLLNYAMQKFRGQTVSIVNMGQFLVAGLAAYVLYHEIPAMGFFIATPVFLLSIWLILGPGNTTRTQDAEA